MAKKQTRRSISVSRSTYERLKSYCETNGISMSQFVETRVGDFLGRSIRPDQAPRPAQVVPSAPQAGDAARTAEPMRPQPQTQPQPRPEPVPRKPAPPPTVPTADQIFTF